jgi:hypothetical protein
MPHLRLASGTALETNRASRLLRRAAHTGGALQLLAATLAMHVMLRVGVFRCAENILSVRLFDLHRLCMLQFGVQSTCLLCMLLAAVASACR